MHHPPDIAGLLIVGFIEDSDDLAFGMDDSGENTVIY